MKFVFCAILICCCPPFALIIVPGAWMLWVTKEKEQWVYGQPETPGGAGTIIFDSNGNRVRNVSRYLSNPNGNYKRR